ncbi:YihY/virulence factor BrkB family protein [Caldibacillus lycopersici]|uniref:YihY/virulence factor BrkB family protein n=1 Tax=Perspicuibacillus lycopersici TaxID=1325689 RepID=A0AAE3LRD3_9BACI|nr:YihY/virulence factor BrkB family protein [Perspicuibacillus lycopersici]MCU9614514.1 YihY/virulence factor BrkB family protein [Perspicuibacillus lycopersici]
MDKPLSIFGWLKTLYLRIGKHDLFGLAAQLAYFFLLSLFPLLITLFSILPFLPITEEMILGFLDDFAPGETLQYIEQNITPILDSHDGGLLSFGIIATIWAASNGMNAIIRAINRAYDVKENRHFLFVRALSVLLTIVMIFVFLLALLLPVFGKHIGIVLSSMIGLSEDFLHVWNVLRWIVSAIILFFMFSALYLVTPNKKLKCLAIIPGAIFSTIGWMVSSFGFSFYVDNFGNYTVTYGSLGVIIILMIWFYLTGVILLLGGEINAIREDLKNKPCP